MKFTPAVAAVASICLLAACGSDKPVAGPTATELRVIRSTSNGLYFSPHLLQERASVFDVSDAVVADRLLGGTPRVRLSAAVQAKMRSEATSVDAVIGRARLIPLLQGGATSILTPQDAAAVSARRQNDGSYAPTRSAGSDDRARALTTEAALLVLRATTPLPSGQLQQSLRWLHHLALTTTDATAEAVAVRALREFHSSLPPVQLRDRAPDLRSLPTLSTAQQQNLVTRAALRVEAVGDSASRPTLDAATVRSLFKTNIADADFATVVQLIRLMRATGATSAQLRPAMQRLSDSRLPDGTYRSTGDFSGSAIATVYGLRLMKMRGESPAGSETGKASLAYSQLPEVRSRPQERLIALGSAHMAGENKYRADLDRLCKDPSVVPQHVTSSNVVGWYELSTICADSGRKLSPPTITAWRPTQPMLIVGQAMLVLGLKNIGGAQQLPAAGVDRAAMLTFLQKPPATVGLTDLALVGTAYLTLTGGDGRELLDDIRTRASASRGCPGLPTMYRNLPGDQSCDLRTTVAVENFLSE